MTATAARPAVEAAARFVAGYRAFAADGGARAPEWLRAWREAAIGRFAQTGFPAPHEEAWRFTSIAPIVETSFTVADHAPASTPVLAPAALEPFLVEAGPTRHALVCVNGRFVRELSTLGALPPEVRIGGLAAAIAEGSGAAREHLGKYATPERHGFAALNAAFTADGAFVHVPAGVTVAEPLQIVHVTAAERGARPATHPRTLIVVEREARATILETYAALEADAVYLTNAATELVVGDGARVDHYRIQRESPAAYHVAVSEACQGRDSFLHSTLLVFGGALARHDVTCVLNGAGAELLLNGLTLLAGGQHADHHTTIEHAQPHCASHELFNGIFDDRSRGVFTGRIIVDPGAQRTDSKQTNNSLLLSADARADSQPQLEIYADDVKCTHGSTTGPLDPAAVFYLRSRGLGADEARALLTYGFGAEIVSRVAVEGVRAELDRILRERIAAGLRRARAA